MAYVLSNSVQLLIGQDLDTVSSTEHYRCSGLHLPSAASLRPAAALPAALHLKHSQRLL